uniref:Uncharacterized protein n=1 Tax=Oryza glaberrima TaxID=4538 RepID=I1QQD9_ORYGL
MEALANGGYLLGGQPARCSGGHSTGSNGEGFGGHPATSPPSSSWVSLPREHRYDFQMMGGAGQGHTAHSTCRTMAPCAFFLTNRQTANFIE